MLKNKSMETKETTVNERVILLKTESGLSNLDFCHRANISNGTLNNIQNGENVSPKTLQTISKSLRVRKEWLLSGRGEKMEPLAVEEPSEDLWQDATYRSLQDQINTLKDEVKKAWAVASHLSGGKLNFHKALNSTGVPAYTLFPVTSLKPTGARV